jgi:hypothetical protein
VKPDGENIVTLTLRLPRALQRELATEADSLGLTLDEYALRLLDTRAPTLRPTSAPQAGAELVAFWEAEGVIGARRDVEDSAAHARALRDAAGRRR